MQSNALYLMIIMLGPGSKSVHLLGCEYVSTGITPTQSYRPNYRFPVVGGLCDIIIKGGVIHVNNRTDLFTLCTASLNVESEVVHLFVHTASLSTLKCYSLILNVFGFCYFSIDLVTVGMVAN